MSNKTIVTNRMLLDDPQLAEHRLGAGQDDGTIVLQLTDGEMELPAEEALCNLLYLRSMLLLGVPLEKGDFVLTNPFTSKSTFVITTHMAIRMLENGTVQRTEEGKDMLEWIILGAIDYVYNIALRYHARYHQTIDALGLAKIIKHPKVAELTKIERNERDTAETIGLRIDKQAKKFFKLLDGEDDCFPHNQLTCMWRAGKLKKASIQQMFVACGSRYDLDMHIHAHSITNSFVSGLDSIEDYAIESQAAKIASWQSKDSIRKPQGASRTMRIVGSFLKTLHPGDCGAHKTVPIRITGQNMRAFTHNMIVENGKPVLLTPQLLPGYKDQIVHLVSPYGCRHQNGVCETCLGYGNGYGYMLLPKVNIGELCWADTMSKIGQSILSTKHNIFANVVKYALPSQASDWLTEQDGRIILFGNHTKRKSPLYICIPVDDMRPITDLTMGFSSAVDTFSSLNEISIVDADRHTKAIFPLAQRTTIPHFSEETLSVMSRRVSEIEIDEEYLYIPLHLFPRNHPLIDLTVLSDDMVAFSDDVIRLFRSTLSKRHQSFTTALSAATELLTSKLNINIFVVQLILKSLMLDPDGGYWIPSVENPEDVLFGSVEKVCERRNVTARLVHGNLRVILHKPSTFLRKRGPSEWDMFMGLGRGTIGG